MGQPHPRGLRKKVSRLDRDRLPAEPQRSAAAQQEEEFLLPGMAVVLGAPPARRYPVDVDVEPPAAPGRAEQQRAQLPRAAQDEFFPEMVYVL